MEVPTSSTLAETKEIDTAWHWLVACAAGMLVLGAVAMSSLMLAAQVYLVLTGWLLVIGGVLQIAGAVVFRRFGGFGLNLVFGALIILLGVLCIGTPVTAGSVLGLLLVLGLMLDAVLEGAYAILRRPTGWIWPVLIALFHVVLGVYLLLNPSILVMLLGLLVGVNLLIRGVLLLLVALEMRALASNDRTKPI